MRRIIIHERVIFLLYYSEIEPFRYPYQKSVALFSLHCSMGIGMPLTNDFIRYAVVYDRLKHVQAILEYRYCTRNMYLLDHAKSADMVELLVRYREPATVKALKNAIQNRCLRSITCLLLHYSYTSYTLRCIRMDILPNTPNTPLKGCSSTEISDLLHYKIFVNEIINK